MSTMDGVQSRATRNDATLWHAHIQHEPTCRANILSGGVGMCWLVTADKITPQPSRDIESKTEYVFIYCYMFNSANIEQCQSVEKARILLLSLACIMKMIQILVSFFKVSEILRKQSIHSSMLSGHCDGRHAGPSWRLSKTTADTNVSLCVSASWPTDAYSVASLSERECSPNRLLAFRARPRVEQTFAAC